MTRRFELIPSVTPDGRRIILRALPLTARERARRFAARLRRPLAAHASG